MGKPSLEARIELFLWEKLGGDTYRFLEWPIQMLLKTGKRLSIMFQKYQKTSFIYDYSFLVMPFAKAFEGYMKQLLLTLKLVTHQQLRKDEPKIGTILQDKELFKLLRHRNRDKGVPSLLYAQWNLCRNILFHYDFTSPSLLGKEEALKKIEDICEAIKLSYQAFIGDPNETGLRKLLEAIEKEK